MGLFGGSNDDSGDDGALRRRVEELERRVAALEWSARNAGLSGVTPAVHNQSGVSAEVQQLAMAGQKIQAIKMLRDQTGLGLREAKDIVDRL
jgi:ribosomal protein L7/L12